MTATLERAFALAADRLDGLDRDAEAERRAQLAEQRAMLLAQCPTPLDLACRFDRRTVRTPALELVAHRVAEAAKARDGRLVLSIPPQEGKSTTLRWAVLWLLADNPDRRIVVASYAASLARTSGRIVRSLVESHGDLLALTVDRSHADASDWQLAGHDGGLRAVGVGGGLTGQPTDVLIVDDPIKDQQAADSPTIRENLHEWWSSVALTRLAPGAPIIVVQTRWHEDDLAGRMISEGWPVLNIPAIADGKTPDALDRAPGEWLESARRRTVADWESKRKAVGERTWAALYQGRPAPLEGGVFKRDWFDLWRVNELPAGCSPPVVVVDPADNPGSGDEAGIVVGAAHPATGKGYVLDDLSAAMTVGQWARLALLTCVRRGAPTLAFEKSLSQLATRIREAWLTLHQQATALRKAGGDVDAAVARLSRADDSPDVRDRLAREVAEIVDDVDGILGFGPVGPRIKPIVARGAKSARMQLVAPAFETGRMVMVGRHPVLEHQACFPAGTLVSLRRGLTPIERVRAGDEALTRAGWRRVEWAGQTDVAGCATVRTASGRVLRATPDHRVWVVDQGWTNIRDLVPECKMLECRAPEPDPSSSSKASPTDSTTTATTRPAGPAAGRSDCCTETSGPPRTVDPSPTDGASTTSTTTAATTTRPTCAQCRSRSTTGTTPPSADSTNGPRTSAAKRSAMSGHSVNHDHAPAPTAPTCSCPPASAPSTAPSHAAKPPTRTADANSNERDTAPSVDVSATTVLAVDLDLGAPEPVYDLTVAEQHEFFADGLLVHNCVWQEGQDSPDRVDAVVHLAALLTGITGVATLGRTDERIPTRSTSSRGRSAARIGRSVRR